MPSGVARSSHRFAIVVTTVAAVAVAHAGCGSDPKELFTRPFDAGVTSDATQERAPEVDETLGGPCSQDAQCDDSIACTFDRCDLTLMRCRNIPDDSLCADAFYCNGREKCVQRVGCTPGPVVTCQDDNPCTIDRCVEATKSCAHDLRDLDGDGDPDDHCVGKRDCDDLDPDVASTHSEVCANFKDDNCNGVVDEDACVTAQNDDCSKPLVVNGKGTYSLSTIAAKGDYTTMTACAVATPKAAKDVVMKITVPGAAGGPAQDVEVWANAQLGTNETAVSLRQTCASPSGETCGHIASSPSARAIVRGQEPGSVVYAIVTTQAEGLVDVKVDIRNAAAKPANETCGAEQDRPLDVPFTVSLIDPAKDLASACDKAKTGELAYAFTLPGPNPADVRIFASTLVGSGQPVVSLRDANCTDELRCRVGSSPSLFARGLAPGRHVFTVAGTRQIDASVVVKAYPATTPPPNQSCATAPSLVAGTPLAPNTTISVDLSSQEGAINNGCLPGGPAAAYKLTLTAPSDVLVIGRFPTNEAGSVSLNGPACTPAQLKATCAPGATPQRVSKRNLPAGDYWVVIADELGQTAELSVLVRPALPPTSVGASDNCTAPFTLPSTGGFFTGDTTNATADFGASCDAPGQPIGGAKDQMMRFDLPQKSRVVFDMSGSFYTTLLDLRTGVTCPGTELPNACYVGFTANKSFLDLTLMPGTYWVQVDGYNGDRGPWNLDVRVLPSP